MPVIVEGQTVAGMIEKRHAEIIFKTLNKPAQCRRRQRQLTGGLGQGAQLGHTFKIVEMIGFHQVSSGSRRQKSLNSRQKTRVSSRGVLSGIDR